MESQGDRFMENCQSWKSEGKMKLFCKCFQNCWHCMFNFLILSKYRRYQCYFLLCIWQVKPLSYCQIWKSVMFLELKDVIWCNSSLLRFHPIFHSHCPTDHIRFLLYLSHNAFNTTIEIDNRMRSILSSLTYQTPSDSIRFFKTTYDRVIVQSHCLIFHPIFQPIP